MSPKSGDNYIEDSDALTQMHMKDIRVYSIDYTGPLQFNDTRTVAKLEPKIKELCTCLIRQISIIKKGFDSDRMKKSSNENIQGSL